MVAIKIQAARESLSFAQGKRGQLLGREPGARKDRGEVWRCKRRGHALGRARRAQPGKLLQRPGCPGAPGRRFSVTLTAGPPLRSSTRAGRALRAGTEPGCPGGFQPAELWFSAELLSPRVQKPRNRPDRGSAIGKLTWLQRGTNSGARVPAAAQGCPKHGLLLSPAALAPAALRPRRLCPTTGRSGSGRGSPPPPAPSRVSPAAFPSSSAGETYLPNRPGHPRSPKRLCASSRGAPPWISKRALPS